MQEPFLPLCIDRPVEALIELAVGEDLGVGDKTVELAIPESQVSGANIVARKGGIFSGGPLIGPILRRYDPGLKATVLVPEGGRVTAGQMVATISGPTRGLLSAERVVLNFLSHLSGIATLTRQYVDAVAQVKKPPAITDTRKTTPGFRALDKYAVRCGGGVNHRMGLYDGVMLKDNHLAALRSKLGRERSWAELTSHIRERLDRAITLWLEVDTLEQLQDALPGGGADIILLDNFSPLQLHDAVQLRDAAGSKVLLEASGGVTLQNLPEIASTGVDRIAIGALTHSAPILDLSMELA